MDLTPIQSAMSTLEAAPAIELKKDRNPSPFLAFGTFKSDEAILDEDLPMAIDTEVTELCRTDENKFKSLSPASTNILVYKDEFKENKQTLGPYLAFGKFKADPIEEKAKTDKVEGMVVEFKPDESFKNDEIKDIKLDSTTDGDIKTEGKDSINFDDARVSCKAFESKPRSLSPPLLAFGKFKRGITEPRTIKSEVVDQDIVILDHGDPSRSVVEEAGTSSDNAVGIDVDSHAHGVGESSDADNRAERLASIPVHIHEDADLIPHDEDSGVDQPLHGRDNVETTWSSPAIIDRRPAKRQRFFIELPTSVESVYGKKVCKRTADAPSIEELNEKIEKMKNPKVKKLQGFGLSLDTVRDRLLAVGLDPYPIALEKEIQDVMVKRRFISLLYGGNTQSTLPSIGKSFLDSHGLDDFMYPNLDLNPHAPEMPGSPGLFFGADGEDATTWDSGRGPGVPERVITRIRPGIWQYQGQYILTPAKSLTREEWMAQSSKVHSTWAKQIMKKDWGRTVRCRVSLRKQNGREFTEEEFEEAINEKGVSYKDGIDENDILQALLRGDEFIAVWTMKCVGYDAGFQRNLAEKYPTWVPPPSKPKKGQGRGGKGKKTTVAPKQEVQSDDDSSANGPEQDDSGNESDSDYEEMKRNKYLALKKVPRKSKTTERNAVQVGKKRRHNVIEIDEEEELVYKSRGTRSRPIRIWD